MESCIKVLDIGAMRQREKFMSSFRKTTSLFVAAVIGFFLASFLFFFSLCGLYLRRDYAHVIRKTSSPLCPLRTFFALCTCVSFLDIALFKEINRLYQIFQYVNMKTSNN